MNKVRLTPAARQDMRDIKTYISKNLQNPIAATSVTGRITKDLRILIQHGEAGVSLQAKTGYASDLRVLFSGDYLIVYRFEEPIVSVARILNGRQDYLRILLEVKPRNVLTKCSCFPLASPGVVFSQN